MAESIVAERSIRTTKKAHVIRLNPTLEQEQYFYRAAGVARVAWNWGLDEYHRIKEAGEKADWNEIKKSFRSSIDAKFPFVREVTKCSAEQAIADLRQAINTYYKVKQSDSKSDIKFPSYRKRSKKVGGFGLANDKFYFKDNCVYIPKLGLVNIAERLRFEGKILSGRVKERAGKWYLTVVLETAVDRLEGLSDAVGIDFGLKSFAALSTGEVYETQGHLRQSEKRLKGLNRGLARKKIGSNKRRKWKMKLARQYERVSDQRKDFLHKTTSAVTSTFAVVCIEDLNLKGLVKTRLAKSFSDAGIGEAVRQLEYKTEWNGSTLQKVDRFFPSSKLCSVCGWKNAELKLSDREWDCSQCSTHHDRDFNASVNIKLEGIRLLVGNGSLHVNARGCGSAGWNALGSSETWQMKREECKTS